MGVLSEEVKWASIEGFFYTRNGNDTGEYQISIVNDKFTEIVLGGLYDEILKAVQLVDDFGP